jgi:threonine aldolase
MKTDLRSDTFTTPTPAMLEYMFQAKVGDDVFGEDPAINELEAYSAGLFGMEAALFCPSGTMTNQIAINVHTRPADEVICESSSHIYQYEGGGIAFNSGCQAKLLPGNRGRLLAEQVKSAINNKDDVHKPLSRLVSLENTSNRGGGSCYEFADIQLIKKVCIEENLNLHLDGARLWNALVAKKESPQQYGEVFDSISICLSKGLGAPVGSLLLGNLDFIKRARRVRKLLGGGMRQAGYLAAAGLFAIKNHVERLKEDHLHARSIAAALSEKSWIEVWPVETNILIFDIKEKYSASELVGLLKEQDIWCLAISPQQIRMVTHLNVTSQMIDRLLSIIRTL